MILTALRSTGQVNCRILFYWNLSDDFLMIRIGLFIFGRKIIEIRCHSYHVSPRLYTIKIICHRGCHPWSHGRGSVCLISPLRSYTMFLSTLYVFCGRKSPHRTQTLRGKVMLHLLGSSINNFLKISKEFFCLSIAICLFNNFYQYEVMDIYFTSLPSLSFE